MLQPYVLKRASPLDFPEIVKIQYDSFTSPFEREVLMGCVSPSDLSKLSDSYAQAAASDPTGIWIKAIKTSTGEIVAASHWKLYLDGERGVSQDEEDEEHDERPKAEERRKIFASMGEARRKNMGGEAFLRESQILCFVLEVDLTRSKDLHILFTHPEYQRKGLGSMMMDWGCRLANLLELPSWIEASADGTALHKKFGFVELEKVQHEGVDKGVFMRRESVSNSAS